MKKLLLRILLPLLMLSSLFPQSPTVQQIVNSVNLDSLVYFVRELSGDVPTIINGSLQTILSRHKGQPGNELAENYIKQKLELYGLNTIIQSFSTSGKNILATQTGTEFQNRKYIICAHYDDMPGSIAPGADDNASGTAAVIEAARILSQYSFPYTIVYALWDEEEQGSVGSAYYATQAYNEGDLILGVINLDMIAYDSNSDGVCNVTNRASGLSKPLYNNIVDLNNRYGINLNIIPIVGLGSDHVSFWYSGYDAMELMEDLNDFNTHYHSTSDLLQYFNQPYHLKMSKLALGTLAVFALDLNLDLFHTPITLNAPGEETNISLLISNGPPIGNGSLAPRMYYRIKEPGGNFGNFTEVVGTSTDGRTYSFIIPALQNGTLVQYYLAAQDDNSTTVTTLPVGGGGYNPPGNSPPEKFIQFLVADLTAVMLDEANSMDDWTGDWSITTSEFVSPPSSFTDSPSGNYLPSSIASLQYNKQINVLNTISTFVEFDAKWDIERMNDLGMVEISTDGGSSWSSVAGQYTSPDVKNSFGYVNVYDGIQTNWVHEIMNVSNFVNDQFSLRFRLWSSTSINKDGWYIDNFKVSVYATILAKQPTVDKTYAEKNVDSVLFRIKFTNIYNHQFTANLFIANSDNSLIDSLTLFDDGLHGDSLANDGLYGAYIPPRPTEDFYSLSISTVDHEINNYIYSSDICRFTTAGPITVDSIESTAFTNNRFLIKPFLENNGTDLSLSNIQIKAYSNDPWVTQILPSFRTCSSISPGEVKTNIQAFAVTYDSLTFPGYFNLKFDISMDGWTYWTDSIKVIISPVGIDNENNLPLTFKLEQNYPNPFNPTTKIKYTIPNYNGPLLGGVRGGLITMKVYDVLGRVVATLVNETKQPGEYEVEFNAANLPSGVYFYQLKAGELTDTKKMILLK